MFNSATFNQIQFNSVAQFASNMIVNIIISRPITLNASRNAVVLNAVRTGLTLSTKGDEAILG